MSSSLLPGIWGSYSSRSTPRTRPRGAIYRTFLDAIHYYAAAAAWGSLGRKVWIVDCFWVFVVEVEARLVVSSAGSGSGSGSEFVVARLSNALGWGFGSSAVVSSAAAVAVAVVVVVVVCSAR